MKSLIINLIVSLGLIAVAQSAPQSTLHQRIAEDEKTLSIQIDGFRQGHPVHYDQTFDITGLNSLQKERLKYRAFQSQGLPVPLREIQGSILTTVCLLASFLTVLVLRFQRRKASPLNPLTILRSN